MAAELSFQITYSSMVSTMVNNIVDNYEQCGQHNIVASCLEQPLTSDNFWRVYLKLGYINGFEKFWKRFYTKIFVGGREE